MKCQLPQIIIEKINKLEFIEVEYDEEEDRIDIKNIKLKGVFICSYIFIELEAPPLKSTEDFIKKIVKNNNLITKLLSMIQKQKEHGDLGELSHRYYRDKLVDALSKNYNMKKSIEDIIIQYRIR